MVVLTPVTELRHLWFVMVEDVSMKFFGREPCLQARVEIDCEQFASEKPPLRIRGRILELAGYPVLGDFRIHILEGLENGDGTSVAVLILAAKGTYGETPGTRWEICRQSGEGSQ
jgi:hypothetical protein